MDMPISQALQDKEEGWGGRGTVHDDAGSRGWAKTLVGVGGEDCRKNATQEEPTNERQKKVKHQTRRVRENNTQRGVVVVRISILVMCYFCRPVISALFFCLVFVLSICVSPVKIKYFVRAVSMKRFTNKS